MLLDDDPHLPSLDALMAEDSDWLGGLSGGFTGGPAPASKPVAVPAPAGASRPVPIRGAAPPRAEEYSSLESAQTILGSTPGPAPLLGGSLEDAPAPYLMRGRYGQQAQQAQQQLSLVDLDELLGTQCCSYLEEEGEEEGPALALALAPPQPADPFLPPPAFFHAAAHPPQHGRPGYGQQYHDGFYGSLPAFGSGEYGPPPQYHHHRRCAALPPQPEAWDSLPFASEPSAGWQQQGGLAGAWSDPAGGQQQYHGQFGPPQHLPGHGARPQHPHSHPAGPAPGAAYYSWAPEQEAAHHGGYSRGVPRSRSVPVPLAQHRPRRLPQEEEPEEELGQSDSDMDSEHTQVGGGSGWQCEFVGGSGRCRLCACWLRPYLAAGRDCSQGLRGSCWQAALGRASPACTALAQSGGERSTAVPPPSTRPSARRAPMPRCRRWPPPAAPGPSRPSSAPTACPCLRALPPARRCAVSPRCAAPATRGARPRCACG